MLKKTAPFLFVLFIALAFRTYRLTDIPPGLTHDEANHGREAIGILSGDLRFYFPANYGSEPVYSYTAAGSMLVLGQNLLALRLVNVIFGLGAMGVAYGWTARLFDRRMALLAAGVTAVTFWPVASSREALRAGMLPFFMALAVWFFWQIIGMGQPGDGEVARKKDRRVIHLVIAFGLSVAITLHIYLAARVAWLIFPIFLFYLALVDWPVFRRSWRPVLAGLLLAGLLVIPMFVYLANNPEAQTRLTMLDGPLQALRAGDFTPILSNVREALLAFIWPGYGDSFLAYNIPGRPVFDGITAVFFTIGLLISLWRWRRPPYAFLLIWFGVGIVPSLLTGATANTTRNLAALTAVCLLPAVGFTAVADGGLKRWETGDWRLPAKQTPVSSLQSLVSGAAVLWLLFAAGVTVRDYFTCWGSSPEVRGAYQHTLAEELAFLEQTGIESPVVISSVYPGPAHDPSISLVLSPSTSIGMRWVDARRALLFPGGKDGRIIIPTSTPLHPALTRFVDLETAVSLPEDDLDPGFGLYQLNAGSLPDWQDRESANFGDAVILLGAHWTASAAQAGTTSELITLWQVTDPARVGPVVPPFDTTDVVLFTQVLDESGQILAQYDALDAPSWSWQPGDLFIQVHPITIPTDTKPGSYTTIVGLYDKLSGVRLPVLAADGTVVDTFTAILPLRVSNP